MSVVETGVQTLPVAEELAIRTSTEFSEKTKANMMMSVKNQQEQLDQLHKKL